MIKDYEDFKKFILQQTTIDLNAYKERQMKRRIDTLIARNKYEPGEFEVMVGPNSKNVQTLKFELK